MSVLFKDNKEAVVTCNCGCGEGIHLVIDNEYHDTFALMSYFNGNFYRDQYGVFGCFWKKLKKIWKIIRNKDYCYADIMMSRKDFEEFKAFVNQFDAD